jgi:FKBP-type peptidyl-prolyl cis-trans isomerase
VCSVAAASTSTKQRIGIWIIVIALSIGTLASFVAIVLSNKNSQSDAAALKAACTQYTNDQNAQTTALSAKYYDTLNQYASKVGTFDKASVTSLQTEDLKVGDGDEVTEDSTYAAYYIGWNPSGKVFDESITDGTLKAPLTVTPGGVISGWTEGTQGMKLGGVRELTIPSDKAYGSTGSGADIPADTPLKFIVLAIPTPEKIATPDALKQYQSYIDAGYISYVCQ